MDTYLDCRHHFGGPVGSPPCLVVEWPARGPCPEDAVYEVTGEDKHGRFFFGSCVEHAARLRTERVAFAVVQVTTKGS